jgi:hypothetical protein
MIVRKPKPEGNFYILDKSISEDKNLSWAARGLLIYLLGKPDNWDVSPKNIVNETKDSEAPLGRDGVYRLLKQLINAGYATQERQRNDDGTLRKSVYVVGEKPTRQPKTDIPELVDPQPKTPLPNMAKPNMAKQTQASIDYKQGLITSKDIKEEGAAKKIGFDFATCQFTNLDAFALEFKRAYPSIQNLDAEISRAAIWIVANPSKRPKLHGRFLTAWLTRAEKDTAKPPKAPSKMDILTGRARAAAKQQPAFMGETFDV